MAAAADVGRVPEVELKLGFEIFGGDPVTGSGVYIGGLAWRRGKKSKRIRLELGRKTRRSFCRTHCRHRLQLEKEKGKGGPVRKKNKSASLSCVRGELVGMRPN